MLLKFKNKRTCTVCFLIPFKYITPPHPQYSFLPSACSSWCWLTVDSVSRSPHWDTWERDLTQIQTLPTCPKGTPRALIRGCRRCCARTPAVSSFPNFLVLCLFLFVNLCLLSPSPSLSEALLLHRCLYVYLPARVCLLIFFCLFYFFFPTFCVFTTLLLLSQCFLSLPTSCLVSFSPHLLHSLTLSLCIWPHCQVIREEPERDTSERWCR